MLKLSSLILFLCIASIVLAQSPHGAEFSIECNVCHTPDNWKVNATQTKFNHNTTKFPLTGMHGSVDCRSCHVDLDFSKAQTDCSSCHADVHQQTVGRDCERCHTTNSWLVKNTTQIHQQSRFPLVGPHALADCYSCHRSLSQLRFETMGIECIDCHREQYVSAPNHVSGNYSRECLECHTINSKVWTSTVGFTHDFFPLTQGHENLECAQCHGPVHKKVSPDCNGCHQKDYLATTNPSHSLAKFSTQCTNCHSTIQGWKPASFDHNTSTSFQLNGGHIGVDCISCHATGFAGTSTTCVSCHLKDYNATTNPAHAAAKFSKECTSCHNETTWKPSTFDHNTSTSFQLKGGHVGVDCISCHATGFVGTSTTCVSCHLKDYNATTNPAHAAAKFSKECTSCHNETTWKPSTFDHNTSTSFQLKGGHIGVDCISCHATGFAGTPSTCVSCHLKDYNATTNPAHAAAKFSTDCLACHNQSTWTPSTFNHDAEFFRIYSGKHRGEWTTCDQCHTNAANFAVFSCLTCHEHNKTETDSHHREVGGYIYNSNNCLLCHKGV